MTLYSDVPLTPDSDRIEAEAEALQRIGLSPAYAWGVAQQSSRRDLAAERETREERQARADRAESATGGRWLAERHGELRTLAERMNEFREAAAVGDQLERRREASEQRQRQEMWPRPAPSIGQLSGGTTPVPPAENPASRRARLTARAREIIASGPKAPSVKETPEQYAERYGRPSGGDGGVRYRNEVVRRDGGEIIAIR
jgi:hypothetical protein